MPRAQHGPYYTRKKRIRKKRLLKIVAASVSLHEQYGVRHASASSNAMFLLGEHNNARSTVGLPDLVWDVELEKMADNWAYEIANHEYCEVIDQSPLHLRHAKYRHSGKLYPPFYYVGESIGLVKDGMDAVSVGNLWRVKESAHTYSYGRWGHECTNKESFEHKNIHLHIGRISGWTQAYWAETTNVGCSIQKCSVNDNLYATGNVTIQALEALTMVGSTGTSSSSSTNATSGSRALKVVNLKEIQGHEREPREEHDRDHITENGFGVEDYDPDSHNESLEEARFLKENKISTERKAVRQKQIISGSRSAKHRRLVIPSALSNLHVVVCNYGPGGNVLGRLPFSPTTAQRLGLSPLPCDYNGLTLEEVITWERWDNMHYETKSVEVTESSASMPNVIAMFVALGMAIFLA